MNRKSLYLLFSLLTVIALTLGACAPAEQATEEATAPQGPAEATPEPAEMEQPG